MAWITAKETTGFLVRWREGGRRVRTKYAPTREAAELLKAELDSQATTRRVLRNTPGLPGWGTDGTFVPSAIEESFAFTTYLRGVIERDRSLRPASRDTYAHSIRNHIQGTPLGKADVREATPEDVRVFWSALTLGPGALRNVKQLLSKGFNAAVREGIRDDNPLTRAGIRAPAKERQVEIVPLTVDEIERLADAAGTARNRLMVLVLGFGGLRGGELAGLRVQDVELATGRLSLRQQVTYTRGSGPAVAPLKTRAARRTVTLPASVTEDLRAFIAASPPSPGALIFTTKQGAPLGHSAVNHVVQDAATRAGMRPVHAHLLRHSAASILIQAGASPVSVQKFLGHASIAMTLGVYAHEFEAGGQALADSMENLREAHRAGRSP